VTQTLKISAGAALASMVALASVLGGCAGVPERAGGESLRVSASRASASTVFLPGGTSAAMAGVDPRDLPEYVRGDGRMGAVPPGPMLATAQWEQPEQPTIERPRYLTFTTSSTSAVFFLPKVRRYER
jgi:hypothetical protein